MYCFGFVLKPRPPRKTIVLDFRFWVQTVRWRLAGGGKKHALVYLRFVVCRVVDCYVLLQLVALAPGCPELARSLTCAALVDGRRTDWMQFIWMPTYVHAV